MILPATERRNGPLTAWMACTCTGSALSFAARAASRASSASARPEIAMKVRTRAANIWYSAQRMSRIWIPLPDQDFDVTEVAVPWKQLTRAGHEVVFTTERGGEAPRADQRLLDGVLFGQLGRRRSRSASTAS